MDLVTISIVLQLIFLEGILSIDNAAVLGAMVAHLPNDKPIPWPRWLTFMAGWGDRVLGMQRDAALKVGLLGAYAGRALMLILAGFIIQVPWLRILGALYLLYLAIHHMAKLYQGGRDDHAEDTAPVVHGGFWVTVGAIELADLAFSIDNVIAAVALSDELWVVMLGVAIGIVVMRFAAQIFTRLIAWEPALETGAFLLLLVISAQLLAKDIFHIEIPELAQFAMSVGTLALTVAVARLPFLGWVPRAALPLLFIANWINIAIERIKDLCMLPFRRRARTN